MTSTHTYAIAEVSASTYAEIRATDRMTAQDQRSLTDPLRTLRDVATREGLYDAADYITEQLLDSAWLRSMDAEDGK
jgi:hypothetical protein